MIAIVGIGAAIWCAMASARLNAEFHQWERDRPMEAAIDLSQPGQVTVPFRQTCGVSHGEALCLECEIDRDADEQFQEAFRGLSAKVVIRDADGREIESRPIDVDSIHAWSDQIVLTGLAPFARGDYLPGLLRHGIRRVGPITEV